MLNRAPTQAQSRSMPPRILLLIFMALSSGELRDERAAPAYGQERLTMPAWILVLTFMASRLR